MDQSCKAMLNVVRSGCNGGWRGLVSIHLYTVGYTNKSVLVYCHDYFDGLIVCNWLLWLSPSGE